MSIKKLAKNMKAIRRQSGFSQVTLAKKIGVSQAYIAMLEKGANVNPTLALLTKLAKALKVSVAELVQ